MRDRTSARTLVLALCALLVACKPSPPVLDDLATLPDWSMTDQSGKTTSATSLRGRAWVANFLFTSCSSSCPPLARATAALQEKIRGWEPAPARPRIVSISVDPETDTPERLTEFAATYKADPRFWALLTAPYPDMEKLVVGGFMQPIIRSDRLPDQPAPEAPTPIDTAHGLRFVLVDRDGHIRGLFEQDEASLDKLNATLRALAEAGQ